MCVFNFTPHPHVFSPQPTANIVSNAKTLEAVFFEQLSKMPFPEFEIKRKKADRKKKPGNSKTVAPNMTYRLYFKGDYVYDILSCFYCIFSLYFCHLDVYKDIPSKPVNKNPPTCPPNEVTFPGFNLFMSSNLS